MRIRTRLAVAAVVGGVLAIGTAPAALAVDPGVVEWDATAVTAEYGDYWQLSATAGLGFVFGPWTATGTLSGTPSGYVAQYSAYQSQPDTLSVYVYPQSGGRPLDAGSYSATLAITGQGGAPPTYSPSGPATLTIAPAALTTTLQVAADPSNPANAIISSELTGPFRSNFFTASYPEGPLGPVGTWTITVTDENGDVVHEASVDRAETSDIMGVSSYWSDVPPGTYQVRAAFTTSGPSAGNFAITAPAPVTYTAAPAPGATSTAAPAPPAPPPAADDAGMTLPAWIPVAAGVLSAGLLAFLIVQIVRLRRAGAAPIEPHPTTGSHT